MEQAHVEPDRKAEPMAMASMMSWGKFAATIGISTALMFPLMYHLVYSLDHVTFSITRLISALLMGAVMVVIMLSAMWSMLRGTAAKIIVLVGALAAAFGLLALNRSQLAVGDTEFMEAMIPHHSIAVNNARKATIRDPRVRELANRIILDQMKEIAEMNMLIHDIQRNGTRGNRPRPAVSAVLTPERAKEAEALVRGKQ